MGLNAWNALVTSVLFGAAVESVWLLTKSVFRLSSKNYDSTNTNKFSD